MNPLRPLLVLAATATLTLAPLAAFAGTLSTADHSGDVIGAGSSHTIPAHRFGDITRTVITNNRAGVTVKVLARDFSTTGEIDTFIAVRTNTGTYRRIDLVAKPNHYAGVLTFHKDTPQGPTTSCTGAKAKISYKSNYELVTIPHWCLSNPTWVQVGIGVVTSTDDFNKVYGDDARTNGTVTGADPKFSPKIHR
ncbi:MAG: hypothetical protein JWP74_1099 [Marmoricola sp.]|nr:hypothetical protein [Marmoricola sp.]